MPYVITSTNVKNGFSTTAEDTEIDMLISVVDEADVCLAANGVSDDKGKTLKIYAVRHMLTLASGSVSGTVKSQSAPSGAARSFGGWTQQGEGLASTSYGALVRQLDTYGCLTTILENNVNLNIMSIGT